MNGYLPLLITSIVSAIAFAVGMIIAGVAEKESKISLYKTAKWCMLMGYCLLAVVFAAALAELYKI